MGHLSSSTSSHQSHFFFLELFGPTTMPCATTQPRTQPSDKTIPCSWCSINCCSSHLRPKTTHGHPPLVRWSGPLCLPVLHTNHLYHHVTLQSWPSLLSLSELGEPSTQTLTSLVTFGFGDEVKLQL